MRKYVIWFLVLFVLTACTSKETEQPNEDPNTHSFLAIILETEDSFMVEPKEGQSELSSANKIVVSTNDTIFLNKAGDEIDKDKFEVGQQVKIYYNGMIAESYPAQIHHTGKIQMAQ